MRLIFLLLFCSIISCSKNNISTEIEIPTTKQNDMSTQSIEFEKGDVVKLKGSVQFTNGQTTKDVTWESLSPEIVKVEPDGTVTALKEGNSKLKIIANQDKTKFSIIEITVIPVKNRDVQISTGNTSKFLKDLDPKLFNETMPSTLPVPTSSPKINYQATNLTVYTYDISENLLNEATVTVKSLDKSIPFTEKATTSSGITIFKSVPINTLLYISVSKIGYNTKERTEVLKSLNEARIDFGGSIENEAYALQQEPEISKIMINKKPLTDLTQNNTLDNPTGNEIANITLNNESNINIDLYFSKPIEKTSFENSLQVISQPTKNNPTGMLYSKENKKLYFSWASNDSYVSISFINNYDGLASIIYKLKINSTFYDKIGINSLKNKAINLNNLKKSDCLIIKNNNS